MHRLGAFVDFLGRNIFDVGGDRPEMTLRILERPGPIPVELILDRVGFGGSGLGGLLKAIIDSFPRKA